MGCPISAHQTCPVNREANRQILHGNIMYKLIITALQKSRIKRTKWFHPLASESRSESHCMLFRNANIKNAAWKASFYLIKASARRHCRGDSNNFWITIRRRNQAVGKH